jgi:hypothetical protein
MRFFILDHMAKDAYWFRHDANARNDIKIIELRSLHGYEGYGLYFGILEVMREQAHYAIPENKIGMVSVALGESAAKVKEVIEDCVSVGLFERNDGLIYSPSFLDRMSKWEDMKNRNESNGSKGGRPKRNPSDNPNNNPLKTQNKPSIEEDIKGEDSKKQSPHERPTIEQCVQASQMKGFSAKQGEAYFHFRERDGWTTVRGKEGNRFPIENWTSDLVHCISKGYVDREAKEANESANKSYYKELT